MTQIRLKSDEAAVLQWLSTAKQSACPSIANDRRDSICRRFKSLGMVTGDMRVTARGRHILGKLIQVKSSEGGIDDAGISGEIGATVGGAIGPRNSRRNPVATRGASRQSGSRSDAEIEDGPNDAGGGNAHHMPRPDSITGDDT